LGFGALASSLVDPITSATCGMRVADILTISSEAFDVLDNLRRSLSRGQVKDRSTRSFASC
jgi:hypothetical protein